jgi:hypothetical protein
MSARKAKELVEKYYQSSPELFGTSKAMGFAIRMALISINVMNISTIKISKPEYTMIQLEDSFIDLYEYKDYCTKEIELL